MHRVMLFLLAAAVLAPATAGGATSPAPSGMHSGGYAAAPSAPTAPTASDRLGEIAEALRALAVNPAGATGPLGRNCPEARARMRWSNLPCSPNHLPPLPPVPVEDPY